MEGETEFGIWKCDGEYYLFFYQHQHGLKKF